MKINKITQSRTLIVLGILGLLASVAAELTLDLRPGVAPSFIVCSVAIIMLGTYCAPNDTERYNILLKRSEIKKKRRLHKIEQLMFPGEKLGSFHDILVDREIKKDLEDVRKATHAEYLKARAAGNLPKYERLSGALTAIRCLEDKLDERTRKYRIHE